MSPACIRLLPFFRNVRFNQICQQGEGRSLSVLVLIVTFEKYISIMLILAKNSTNDFLGKYGNKNVPTT